MATKAAADPSVDPAAYLRSIQAVRERTNFVLQKAKSNQLNHFNVDLGKFPDTTSYVGSTIKVCTAPMFFLVDC